MAEIQQYEERVIKISRVAKVVKGGRRFSFTALVAVGDGAGRVGIAHGRAKEVPVAIQKAMEMARRSMITVPMTGATVIHQTTGKHDASRVLIKPASPGTGVIAGGAVRQIPGGGRYQRRPRQVARFLVPYQCGPGDHERPEGAASSR